MDTRNSVEQKIPGKTAATNLKAVQTAKEVPPTIATAEQKKVGHQPTSDNAVANNNVQQKALGKELHTVTTQKMEINKIVLNPYARAIIQPAVTGTMIGVTFFPANAFIVGLQNRPAGMSPWEYLKNLKPNAKPDQSIFSAFRDTWCKNARYITNGIKYSCTTSFTKSIFVCNGPIMQKHIEHNFGYYKDMQDPALHSEQYPFIKQYNKWVLTGAISSGFGLIESGATSHFAAKATCSMLKKDIQIQGLYNNLMFAPGGITRTCKAGFGQFAYMGTGHVADLLKIYIPESQFDFLVTGLSAGITGMIGGGVGTLFDNIYTQQLSQIRQIQQSKYKVPSISEIVKHIKNDIGLKGYFRGAIPSMITLPAVFFIAQSINDCFNKLEKNRNKVSPASRFSFFNQNRESKDKNSANQAIISEQKQQRPKGP